MKLVYKGKYTSEADLPVRAHPAGSVPFRELEDMKKLGLILNLASVPLFIATMVGLFLRGAPYLGERGLSMTIGAAFSLLVLLPHELLHAICFRG